jgi:phage shock protein A
MTTKAKLESQLEGWREAARSWEESAIAAARQRKAVEAERDALVQSCADWKETHEETITSMGARIRECRAELAAVEAERDALRARVAELEAAKP